ncbi:MAG: phosphoribosyltransferase family protein [bacterium]
MKCFAKFHSTLRTSLRASLYTALDIILNLLFPKSGLVRELEQMSAECFAGSISSGDTTSSPHSRRFRGHYPPECADWSRAILSYRDRHVRAAVWELKYRKNAKVAKLFAELVAEELQKHVSTSDGGRAPILLVPIPLSEKRQRERGYNQIELILEQLPKNEEWCVAPDLLRRKHHTTPQTKLSRAERLKNLNDCFEVSNIGGACENTRDRKIFIIDDVMTTGSTLGQARETLRRAGASEVLAIALAH